MLDHNWRLASSCVDCHYFRVEALLGDKHTDFFFFLNVYQSHFEGGPPTFYCCFGSEELHVVEWGGASQLFLMC